MILSPGIKLQQNKIFWQFVFWETKSSVRCAFRKGKKNEGSLDTDCFFFLPLPTFGCWMDMVPPRWLPSYSSVTLLVGVPLDLRWRLVIDVFLLLCGGTNFLLASVYRIWSKWGLRPARDIVYRCEINLYCKIMEGAYRISLVTMFFAVGAEIAISLPKSSRHAQVYRYTYSEHRKVDVDIVYVDSWGTDVGIHT